MSVQSLLKQYQDTPRLFQLVDRLSFSQPERIYLKDLQGSSAEFVVASAFLHPSCDQFNHLIILNDAEEAAYFHNTLENLTGALDIFYFPSSFKNKKNYRLLNSSHVMLRTEALTKIATGGNKRILVTYPEALFEKVVVPDKLSSNIIRIKTGESLEVGELLLKLADYGFQRTDFVYEPGQFAIRGGILDIYSFGNDKPYRIELFGNDVDSIRIVDPETQLSERKLLQVSIIPNVDTQFENTARVSLFDFLPENTIIWVQDYDFSKEKILDCEEDLQLYIKLQEQFADTAGKKVAEEDDDKLLKKQATTEDFISANDFANAIQGRHVVEFSHKPSLGKFEIDFNTKEQPAFNRQFDLLIKDLKVWEKKGFQLYLFADNPKQ
ncbi:MAG: transcription-repair coupling factor, partial [Bacteroidetes bacterium]|nr:transcription-repair coupling factor [Bacteroidota bacterium]